MGPISPGQFEVRYKFTDQSEMTLIKSDLMNIQMPGKELLSEHVDYNTVKHFNRVAESFQIKEFQTHLQYAKFLHWLNNMPEPADLIEVQIQE